MNQVVIAAADGALAATQNCRDIRHHEGTWRNADTQWEKGNLTPIQG